MIESITLQGFKSFAERTRLDFGPGVVAVIGPNGSGKSNVVEAIRWATHQARARELRAAKATELIFHGSGGKAPLGLAEVQLELRGPGGKLSLSRRIYRDGSAEQDLAGRPARVRDIHQALRGTGLGPGGLAVIGQGEVVGVVQAEGQTLLGYLQEAAGLSRAVAARQDAEQRLQAADRSLHELGLIEEELVRQVQQLEKSAQDARLHRQLSLRELALGEALQRQRQETLAAELRAARQQAAQLEAHSAELARQTLAAAAELEAATETLRAERAEQAGHAQALELLGSAQDAHQQVLGYVRHLQAERHAVETELAALTLKRPPHEESDPAPLQAQLSRTRAELGRLETEHKQAQQALERARRSEIQQAEAAARSATQRRLLESELAELEAALAGYGPALTQARAEAAAALAERQRAEAERRELTEGRARLQAEREGLTRRLAELRAARAPLLREQARLETLLGSYARYGEGPRHALTSGHPGLIGSVADLVRVEAEYQVAITAALGRRLEQVVVRRAEDAREIIDLLKRRGGRATFLPLDLLRARPRRDAGLLRDVGVLGNLADLCPSDPPQIAEALLADTLLVRDLAAATRLARQFQNRPRLVTPGGELLEPGGALTGGRLRDGGADVLADQRRMQDLMGELQQLDEQERRAQAEEAALGARLSALPIPEAVSGAAEREAERRVTQLDTAQRSAAERQGELRARLERLDPAALPEVGAGPLAERQADLEAQLLEVRREERDQGELLAQAREAAAAWALYRAEAARHAALQARLGTTTPALEEQTRQLQLAEAEVVRRQQEADERRPAGLQQAEQRQQELSRAYANLLARQNKLRAELEAAHLLAARREGSLEDLPDGAQLPGSAREWSAELGRVRAALSNIGPVNALAETEHMAQAQRLATLQAERGDAARAAAELRAHLADLTVQEAGATAAAFRRVNAAFAEYSRELLGGSGELEAERGEHGHLTGLRLAVQPKGKRTRNLNLLSAGERTMAGLGFLFALNHAAEGAAGGLPLAVLDEVDAPLDEANIRRFTHFLQVFAGRGAQFLLVTHQKATMEVAQAIWGVTTDQSGASRLLSIRQGDTG
ncbi:chromosome segregation protein SMC [Deinococcus irradiatisoli]|uniref:Chromosome partition protein Smc n=1 Tax=Deinococcus irradiatisoli TaxID=2202254 RepID=A0A2Z3JID4_9DEIO|nr:chromosome segregation SMC family protein [Deinococcus irradiatisoli]AWN23140.1 chromosome segregation protein SMC [Deinococcus irradiatisoli]